MTGILQIQHDRIKELVEAEIGMTVLQYPPAMLDQTLPVMLPMVERQTITSASAHSQNLQTDWILNVYLRVGGTALELVNRVDLYEYLDRFTQLFWSRRHLEFGADISTGLQYTRDTRFQLVNGLDRPLRYPLQSPSSQVYWGCQYRLSIFSDNYPTRVTS